MFRHLSTRFIVATLHVMFLSAVIAFVISNMYYHTTLKAQNDERLTKVLMTQKDYIEKHPNISADDFFQQLAQLNFQVLTIDSNHHKKSYGTQFRVDNLELNQLKLDSDNIYHGIKHRPFNLFITGFFDNESRNTVGTEMKINQQSYHVFIRPDVGESMHEFRSFLAILLLLTIILSILFVFLSSKYIVHPVTELKKAAQRIGEQSGYQMKVNRKDELGILAQEMNEMSKKIKQHEEINQRFVANVSHEIQSPITNLLGQINKLKETQDLSLLNQIEHQSTRLSGLTKQLLLLASIEQNKISITKQAFNFKVLIQEVIRDNMYTINQKDIFLSTQLEDVIVSGDRDLCYQMITNILSNAIKYSPNDSEIHIELKEEHNNKLFTIQDHGYGMTEETQKMIFERFYKSNVNEDNVTSNGLGMAIVKEILDVHRFAISIESTLDKGTTIIIDLQ
ncbi:HAMP domain-containing sensor histidine kinase [Macrococcus equi]|uniref:HAMP domain-containing sensor histidine kinase n=1 Tax=Macrococcus equi TaxID=3395462 RepID=UPI0039BDE0F1